MRLAGLALAVLLAAACSNAPIPATPHPGFPCGYVEHSCGDGACCANGSVCGGPAFSGCPASACCDDGTDEDGELAGRRRVVTAKRWPGGRP